MLNLDQQLLGANVSFLIDPSWLGAFWFLVAVFLLDSFDISLPRGDSTGVAGALCAAAIVVLGPTRAGAVALVSAIVTHAIRRGTEAPRRLGMVVTARGAAIVLVTLVLRGILGAPLFVTYVVIPAAFLMAELIVSQAVASVSTGRPFLRLLKGNARSQTPLIAAQWSASALLLVTYAGMGPWSLVPVVALLLLMRQSYAMFLDIRETYRTTVEVLVEAAESQDLRRVGHADRTAAVAREVASRIGLSAAEVERISYAALLHDLGELAEGVEPADEGQQRAPSADVVHGVEFFEGVEPILRVCDGGATGSPSSDDDLLAALIVALASDIDAEYHPEVAAAHHRSTVDIVAPRVTAEIKAKAVGAALRLGYRIPAVG